MIALLELLARDGHYSCANQALELVNESTEADVVKPPVFYTDSL